MVEQKQPTTKTIVGTVQNWSGDKTIRVRVEKKEMHPLYKKVVKSHNHILAHCTDETVQPGDEVIIREGTPISKGKSWFYLSGAND